MQTTQFGRLRVYLLLEASYDVKRNFKHHDTSLIKAAVRQLVRRLTSCHRAQTSSRLKMCGTIFARYDIMMNKADMQAIFTGLALLTSLRHWIRPTII